MDQIVEQWRPVLGYEHGYEVSDQGGVRSLYRNGRHLKPSNCRGYKQVVLYAQGRLDNQRSHSASASGGSIYFEPKKFAVG
jgi:hypothetical protein